MRTKHIIQTTLRMAAFAAVFILAVSCTSDMFDQRPNGTGSDSKYAVSFSLGNRHVQTRGTRAAADVSGYERETAITLDNTHHMYAVIFNASDKKWFKTVEINSSDYSNGTFTFDMGQGGDYYMYLVANTVETTKLTDLTAETTEDDFFQIIDETSISDAGIGTTDFLMVSGRQHVNIDLDVTQGPTTTDLDAVLVYRRATRIDIDGSGVTGLQIKKVVMNKRYKDASYLVRADNNNAPAVAPGASGDGYVTTTYQLNGTATTNLIAVTATEQNATGAKVDDDEWQGVIYCYENPTENDTELEITCTIGNVERTTVVPFGTTPVKANTLYTVQLSVEETPTSTAGELSGSITVKDWENVTLTYANLTDTQVPNFTVVSGATASGTNPAAMRVVRRADSDVILEVTSTGVYGSEVAFLNRTDVSYNFSSDGGTITRSSTVTYNESGQIVETFTIHIPAAMAVGLTRSDYLTFAVSNAYNSDSKRTFTITSIPKLPIEYVAPYNMASATAFATDNTPESSMYFSWNNSTASTNGVGTVAWTSAKSDIQAFITGTAVPGYHLPSKAEWCSIIAPYHTQNNGTGNIDSDMSGTNGDRITYKNGQHMGLTERVAWGVTNASGTYSYEVNQVFYNDYNCPNDAAHETIGYGLRFKDDASTNGEYTCAYRYEYKASDAAVGGASHASLTVKVIYVGADPSVTIATISDESWWASPDYTLVLPACGHSNYTNGSNQNPGYYSSATNPAYGYYWSATPRDESDVWYMAFGPSFVLGNGWYRPGYGFSVRLFADR